MERKDQLQEVRSKRHLEYSGSKNSEQEVSRKLRLRKLLLLGIFNGE